MSALDQTTADKLAKICGLFGSAEIGERAAAAAMADKLVKQGGFSWFDIIRATAAEAVTTVDDMIGFALDHDDALTVWEWGFVNSIHGRQFLTSKQLAKLQSIVARLREDRRAA